MKIVKTINEVREIIKIGKSKDCLLDSYPQWAISMKVIKV